MKKFIFFITLLFFAHGCVNSAASNRYIDRYKPGDHIVDLGNYGKIRVDDSMIRLPEQEETPSSKKYTVVKQYEYINKKTHETLTIRVVKQNLSNRKRLVQKFSYFYELAGKKYIAGYSFPLGENGITNTIKLIRVASNHKFIQIIYSKQTQKQELSLTEIDTLIHKRVLAY